MIYAVKYNVDNVEPFGTFETEEEFKAKIQELSEPFFRLCVNVHFCIFFVFF